MRDLHTTTLEMLVWLSDNGPSLQYEMAAAGFTRVSSKVNYLREEELITGTPTGKRGYAYGLSVAGRRKVSVLTQQGEIVQPRSIAFSGTYRGPDWLPVRSGGMDAFRLASVGT